MLLTLKNARRLDTEIQTAMQEVLLQARMVQSVEVSFHDDFDSKIETAKNKIQDGLRQYVRLSSIRHMIRRQIEMKNESAGINTKMNEEAMIREEVGMLELIIQYYLRNNSALTEDRVVTTKRKLDNLKLAANRPDSNPTEDSLAVNNILSEADVDSLNVRIRDIRRRLNEIKDTCAFMNSDPKNSIELAVSDVDYLKQLHLI